MSKKVKAEILIMVKSKFFIWISFGLLVLMCYNVFSVAAEMQTALEGGYYTYTIMTLSYLIGIIEPIAVGAFLGGFDESEGMTSYKLCNQTRREWIMSKAIALIVISIGTLFAFNTIGIVIDLYKGTIYGSTPINLILISQRFFVVLAVWLLWGAIGFTIALLLKSPGLSLTISLVYYFGEQYLGQYISLPHGILWNQKSVEHFSFHEDEVPFGVVQNSYLDVEKSSIYLLIVLLLCCIISYYSFKRKYPQK